MSDRHGQPSRGARWILWSCGGGIGDGLSPHVEVSIGIYKDSMEEVGELVLEFFGHVVIIFRQ